MYWRNHGLFWHTARDGRTQASSCSDVVVLERYYTSSAGCVQERVCDDVVTRCLQEKQFTPALSYRFLELRWMTREHTSLFLCQCALNTARAAGTEWRAVVTGNCTTLCTPSCFISNGSSSSSSSSSQVSLTRCGTAMT
jgi:hypothetical protein